MSRIILVKLISPAENSENVHLFYWQHACQLLTLRKQQMNPKVKYCSFFQELKKSYGPFMRKPDFCLDAKTKAQISCAVTAKPNSAFVFTTLFNFSLS